VHGYHVHPLHGIRQHPATRLPRVIKTNLKFTAHVKLSSCPLAYAQLHYIKAHASGTIQRMQPLNGCYPIRMLSGEHICIFFLNHFLRASLTCKFVVISLISMCDIWSLLLIFFIRSQPIQ